MENKTLLVIVPGRNVKQYSLFNLLVAETGEFLASHCCSNAFFAYDDLYGQRKDRQNEWSKRFGELEVKFIDEVDLTKNELVRRNKQWLQNLETKKE